MKKQLSIFILILSISLSSCERNIDIDFPAGEAPYVIEGYIENNQIPYLTISRGSSFLGEISTSDYADLFVKNAQVTMRVSDGNVYILDPVELNNFVVYTNLNVNGEVGKTYDLIVVVDGKTFTSSTKILEPQKFDSVTFVLADGDRGQVDSLVEVTAWFTEPNTPENYYRFLTRRNSEPLFDSRNSYLFNDLVVNGVQLQIPVFRGSLLQIEDPDSAETLNSRYFKLGDTVYMKWASIDQAQYKFWDTFSSQSSSFGNPFSPTVIIKGNVSGPNCIGLWASYGSYLDTLILMP